MAKIKKSLVPLLLLLAMIIIPSQAGAETIKHLDPYSHTGDVAYSTSYPYLTFEVTDWSGTGHFYVEQLIGGNWTKVTSTYDLWSQQVIPVKVKAASPTTQYRIFLYTDSVGMDWSVKAYGSWN